MKIYTKTGDLGETGLFAGPRVFKDDARIEAYGTVDELNAALGVVQAFSPPPEMGAALSQIQNELFSVGAELATPEPEKHGMNVIGNAHIENLERTIDQFEAQLAPLTQFILPGGTSAAAHLHQARTICRRAERRVVTLARSADGAASERIVRYLNRLGDLLFVLSRAANALANVPDVPWQKPV